MAIAKENNYLEKRIPFKFEQLNVWKASLELGYSIGLNIAEGSTGQTDPEQQRFLWYANRSTLKVVACLIKAKTANYLNEPTFVDLYQDCEVLSAMLTNSMKSLK